MRGSMVWKNLFRFFHTYALYKQVLLALLVFFAESEKGGKYAFAQ